MPPGARTQPLDAQVPSTGSRAGDVRRHARGEKDRHITALVGAPFAQHRNDPVHGLHCPGERIVQVAGSNGPERLPMVPGVVVWSRAIEFTLTPWPESWSAMLRLKLTMPALPAA